MELSGVSLSPLPEPQQQLDGASLDATGPGSELINVLDPRELVQ